MQNPSDLIQKSFVSMNSNDFIGIITKDTELRYQYRDNVILKDGKIILEKIELIDELIINNNTTIKFDIVINDCSFPYGFIINGGEFFGDLEIRGVETNINYFKISGGNFNGKIKIESGNFYINREMVCKIYKKSVIANLNQHNDTCCFSLMNGNFNDSVEINDAIFEDEFHIEGGTFKSFFSIRGRVFKKKIIYWGWAIL